MEDLNGNKLEIGDIILISCPQWRYSTALIKAEITGFTPKMMKFKKLQGSKYTSNKVHKDYIRERTWKLT